MPFKKNAYTIRFDSFNQVSGATTVDFATSRSGLRYVGDQQASNTATFTFTPSTVLQLEGGNILIVAPVWYSTSASTEYPFEGGVQCASSRFTQTDQSPVTQRSGSFSTKVFQIYYSQLTGAVKDPITLTCTSWKNPIEQG